jgi:hypothetical protein
MTRSSISGGREGVDIVIPAETGRLGRDFGPRFGRLMREVIRYIIGEPHCLKRGSWVTEAKRDLAFFWLFYNDIDVRYMVLDSKTKKLCTKSLDRA